MGNTQKPTRRQFEECYLSAEDSILHESDVSFIKPQLKRQNLQASPKTPEEVGRGELEYESGYPYQPCLTTNQPLNILPPNLFERKDSFQEIFRKKSKIENKSPSSQATTASNKELLRHLVFIQNSLHLLLPNADYIDEASDAFLMKSHCFLGTNKSSSNIQPPNIAFSPFQKTLERQVIEGTDSRYDDEEFLQQLQDNHNERDPISPLNLSKEEFEQGFANDEGAEKAATPLNRTQLFAQCFLDLGEDGDDDLLSPIKPSKNQPKPSKEAFDRGSLEVKVKPKTSKDRPLDIKVPSIEEIQRDTSIQNHQGFKYKYFNKSPFDKLFQDITNTPALEGKRLAECIEGEEKTEANTSMKKSQAKLPPSGKENKHPPSKVDNKLSKSKDKKKNSNVITLDLTEANGLHKRESLARESQNKRSSNTSSATHSNERKKAMTSRISAPKVNKLVKNQNQTATNQGVKNEILMREDEFIQAKTMMNHSNTSFGQLSKSSKQRESEKGQKKSGLQHFQSGFGGEEQENSSPTQEFFQNNVGDISSSVYKQKNLTPEEEAYLRTHYFKGRQPLAGNSRQGFASSQDGEGLNGQTESRYEMAKLMQSYQIDSGQKPSGNRSQQSEGQQKKLAVNIHKLSQQAMMDLQDFE